MIKWVYNILIITSSISFFISATEMDLGECHNTFFDEYDTYVSEEKVSLNQSVISLEDHNTYILNLIFLSYNSLKDAHAVSFRHEYFSYTNYNTHKLFLRNSVWRI